MDKNNKILFLPKYPRLGASSRMRTYQYLPFWEAAGYECTISPFFNEQYLEELYAHKPISIRNVLRCYYRRWQLLQKAENYDWVVIEKELYPYVPYAWEKRAYKKEVKYILDFDDAIFHNYDKHPKPWVKKLLGDKIDKVMEASDQLWAGNTYLAERANRAGAKKVDLLPTVIDLHKYQPNGFTDNKDDLSVGWIGSSTTKRYLPFILPALEELKENVDFKLSIIADGKEIPFTGKQEALNWSEEKEVALIGNMDIGIMPLEDGPWEQGKCAYKLIQYMACGLPVVASPVGMNKEVVRHGENGFLAETKDEWIKYLSVLLKDTGLRKKMGTAGRKLVEENYTLERNWEKIRGWMAEMG